MLLANAGALDPTFGNLGAVTLPIRSTTEQGFSSVANSQVSASGPGDKVLVFGLAHPSPGHDGDAVIERLDADGSPDPTFGQGGVVAITLSIAVPTAVLAEPDGSILVGGRTTELGSTFALIHLKPDGTLDTSFGTVGIATLPIFSGSPPSDPFIPAMTLTADGHILVDGARVQFTAPSSVASQIFVARFDAAGKLDASFGTSGLATIPVTVAGYTFAIPSKVIVQPSGRIVVAGEVQDGVNASGTQELVPVLIGLTASGASDPTFGGTSPDGVVVLPTSLLSLGSSNNVTSVDMVMASDGSIVLATGEYSTTGQTGHLVRLTVDGAFDPSFGTGGIALITGGLMPQGLTIEGDGKIVVPGYMYNHKSNPYSLYYFAAGRFDANGTPDATFGLPGNPGVQTYPTTTQFGRLGNAFLDAAGHITLVGQSWINTGPYQAENGEINLFRMNASPTVTPALAQPPADLAGTGTTDYAVYLNGPGAFAFLPATGSGGRVDPFGSAGVGHTIPAVGDYLGLGHAQLAAYLPAFGDYAIQATATTPGRIIQFGMPGDGQTIPTPADFEGTGKDDVAVYMPSIRSFAIRPADGSPGRVVPFGQPGAGNSIPATADYFGTGRADIAVYLTQLGAFAIRNPATGTDVIIPFGKPGVGNSLPVPGDYDGSGKVEFAVYVPSLGAFFYRPADGGSDVEVKVGLAGVGEIPAPGDYDGSGHDEFAVYDPTSGFFEYAPANGGSYVVKSFGTPNGGSVPVATPPGDLPGLGGSHSGAGAGASRPSFATSDPSTPAQAGSVGLGQASAVPAGPTLASRRVALPRVNQAAEGPFGIPG